MASRSITAAAPIRRQPPIPKRSSTYYLRITTDTQITNNNFGNQPTVVVTNEFGGTFGDSFAGYTVGFDWHDVPEPSTVRWPRWRAWCSPRLAFDAAAYCGALSSAR